MGEEEKKPVEEKKMEEKKAEDGKKGEEGKKEKEAKPAAEEKKEEKKAEESKEESPPPPQEIILKVYMHCEGCARKVRRCLKGFEGVEDVMTDCKSNKVVVKGEKADPLKVLARVQRKSHRQVELISPIPKPPLPEENKPEEKEKPAAEEKKEEVITVVLMVHMHCEACALELKKRIQRMKGVELAEPDLKSSEVTVKGVFDPSKLVEYVYKRTGKHAVIVKQEPNSKKEEKAKDDSKEEKKGEEGGDKEKKEAGGGEDNKDKKQGGNNNTDSAEAKAPADGGAAAGPAVTAAEAGAEEFKVLELKKYEYHYHPQTYATEYYGYPPQIFSDENPNACSVM